MEPISTAVLAGGSAWLADKLLGPSADALGRELQLYGTSRLKKIFGQAETKIDLNDVAPLPPGFMLQFIQKASYSEDDDALTDAWSSLLANSAIRFNARHSAYVDILSQLNAFDAKQLSALVSEDSAHNPSDSKPVNLKLETKMRLAESLKTTSQTKSEAEDEFARLMKLDLGWPGRITSVRIHFKDGTESRPMSGGVPDQFASFDNLSRLGLIERFDIDVSMKPYETGLEGVLVTMLGIGFVQACRGPK
jgi:hypothetical protein